MTSQICESTGLPSKVPARAPRNEHNLSDSEALGNAINRHPSRAENPDDEHVYFVVNVLVDSSLLQDDEVCIKI